MIFDRWGPQLEQATYKNRQRLYLSEQVKRFNLFVVVEMCFIVKRLNFFIDSVFVEMDFSVKRLILLLKWVLV